ncbi:hypothetical protein C3Z09_22920 [Lelliottia aquatilis]|uniref:hypothetical protein n=1 Tax=Lelliottia aquatilis TaxID=2080838 RepID=UPI000CDE978E|nr:hypothetical protein [Lelliottia aquatilis]POZ13531.1 hypothetical protein C3Z09_22920 [Lelliottia aquatilis]
MSLMSVSQYAKHAGMSRQALYTWEAKQGFPARVDGKIDQDACDAYLARYRCHSDPRTKNAKSKTAPAAATTTATAMSVAAIRKHLAGCIGQAAGMDEDERAGLAAKAVGLYLSTGPYNPPVTFGAYRLAMNDCPQWEPEIIAGGAFGLSPSEVVMECLEHITFIIDDDSETYEVIPSLLYVLSKDN